MNEKFEKQLVVLVEGANDVATMEALLDRRQSLGIRSIEGIFDVFPHPDSVSGCLEAHEFLHPFHRIYAHAIVLLDYAGCNLETRFTSSEVEHLVEDKLNNAGWQDRCAVIVVNPEIENWVWSNSPHVEKVLGWKTREPDLRTWLVEQKWLEPHKTKPVKPKEAMEAALRVARQPRSSSLYRELAEKVSFARCDDPALLKLKHTLQVWFPP